jgi:hypothetical protein
MKRHVAAGLAMCALAACGGAGDPPIGTASQESHAALVAASGTVQDEIAIAGYRDSYTITVGASGDVSLLNKLDGTTQVLKGVKLIKFFDLHTSFDLNGVDGQVYRLYQAAFNRKPDPLGLGFWIKAARAGTPLTEIADGFIASTEFQQMYGKDVVNTKFISLLYNNVLHREPEQAGYDWWVAQVNGGAVRSGVLFGFSDSKENRDGLLADMANGFDFAPFQPSGPIIPKRSSAENRAAALAVLGPQAVPQTGNLPGWTTVSYAFGDFFQDGSYAMVSHTQESDNGVNYPSGPPTGHIRFWKKDATGAWMDRTSDILKDDSGCILSRKAVVADFNNDGIPDVYFACSGFDKEPYDGEYQRILLSDAASHGYKNTQIPVKGYTHGAAAADIDHDGKLDIVVADMRGNGGKSPVYALKGDGKGGFTADYTLFDRAEINWQANGPLFTIELIDFDGGGNYDAIIGGIETAKHRTLIIPYDARNKNYVASTLKVLPADPVFMTPYDFVFDRSTRTIYVNRVNDVGTWGASWPNGVGNAVQKVNYDSMQGSTIFTHSGYYDRKQSLTWIDWIGLYDNRVVSVNAGFGLDIPK